MTKVKHLKISHTSLAAWRKSPRRFLYEYISGLRLKRTTQPSEDKFGSALDFGIAVHKFEELRGLALKANNGTTQEANWAMTIANKIANESSLPNLGNRSKAHLVTLLSQYHIHYHPIAGQHEVELSFPLSDRVTYTTHIDIITESNQLIDLKTTSKHLAYDWLPTIAPNPQAIGYIVAAFNAGLMSVTNPCLTFRGISTDHKLLDPHYIPKKRDGSIGQRPPLFLDVEFTPQQHEILEWRASVERDANRLIENIETFEHSGFTCHCNIGDLCNYRQICLTAPNDRDIVINNMYEREAFRGFELTFQED